MSAVRGKAVLQCVLRGIIEMRAMTSADEEIGLAARDDIAGMLELQEENLIDRGGSLSVAFSYEFFETAIAEMPVVVARKEGRVIGYLLSSPLDAVRRVPIVDAMLCAYKESAGAYLYGPICVAQTERGRGLAGRCSQRFARSCRGEKASCSFAATMHPPCAPTPRWDYARSRNSLMMELRTSSCHISDKQQQTLCWSMSAEACQAALDSCPCGSMTNLAAAPASK